MLRPRISFAVFVGLAACVAVPPPPPILPPLDAPIVAPLPSRNDDVFLAWGRPYATGTRIVLWNEPGGFNAYAREPLGKECFGVRPQEPDQNLRQIVLHYDAVGSSKECFRILHDVRGLSAHFLLDTDGTIYQTLDLKEMAWHAGRANPRSIGIEIANVGAYATREELESLRGRVPEESKQDEPVFGQIRDRQLWQYPFTQAQYEALARLCLALHEAFPEIDIAFPASTPSEAHDQVLAEETLLHFRGLLGHFHIHPEKVDPGPAFDWSQLRQKIEALKFSTPLAR